jgi:sporulation protein YlmC with PRC-barrel domain
MIESSNTHAEIISSDRVQGTAVYGAGADKLGSIDDLMIDKRSGHVAYAVLEFGGFLGLGTDRYPLPWSLLKYDTDRDGYVVPLDKSLLENAPKYSVTDVPVYTQGYGRRVHDYWSVAMY